MKKNITFISLIFVMSQVFAQKIKTESTNASLIHYPIVAVPESFTTYNVTIINQGLDTKEFKIENLEEKIQLQSFKRIKETSNLNINVFIGKLDLFQNLSTKRINSIDELKGRGFDYMVDFAVPMRYEITDSQGILVQKEVLTQTRGFYSSEPPVEPAMPIKAVDINKVVTDYVNKNIIKINDRIRDLFDTYREKYSTEFYVIKPSKTDNYEAFTAAVITVQNTFKNAITNETALQNSLQPSLDFWEKSLNTFDINSEDGKPHYFLCAFNLSLSYLLLDDFDNSLLYLDKAKASNFKQGYAILLGNDITKRKKYKDKYMNDKEIVKQNPSSVYQKDEATKITLTSIVGGAKNESATSETDFMTKGFIINAANDTVFGQFIEFNKNKSIGKILFVPTGKSQEVYANPYTNLKQVSTLGVVYYCAKGLRRAVYASPTLVVMGDDHDLVFGFPVKGKTEVYHTFDPNDGASYMTNYKKKFADIFKEVCPAVSEQSINGSYDLKQTGIEYLVLPIKDFESKCGSTEYGKYAALLNEVKIKKLYK